MVHFLLKKLCFVFAFYFYYISLLRLYVRTYMAHFDSLLKVLYVFSYLIKY